MNDKSEQRSNQEIEIYLQLRKKLIRLKEVLQQEPYKSNSRYEVAREWLEPLDVRESRRKVDDKIFIMDKEITALFPNYEKIISFSENKNQIKEFTKNFPEGKHNVSLEDELFGLSEESLNKAKANLQKQPVKGALKHGVVEGDEARLTEQELLSEYSKKLHAALSADEFTSLKEFKKFLDKQSPENLNICFDAFPPASYLRNFKDFIGVQGCAEVLTEALAKLDKLEHSSEQVVSPKRTR
jgi:hypothetical protein